MAKLSDLASLLQQIRDRVGVGNMEKSFKGLSDFKLPSTIREPSGSVALNKLTADIPGLPQLLGEFSKLNRLLSGMFTGVNTAQFFRNITQSLSPGAASKNSEDIKKAISPVMPFVSGAAAAKSVGWGREAAVAVGVGTVEATILRGAMKKYTIPETWDEMIKRMGTGVGVPMHVTHTRYEAGKVVETINSFNETAEKTKKTLMDALMHFSKKGSLTNAIDIMHQIKGDVYEEYIGEWQNAYKKEKEKEPSPW